MSAIAIEPNRSLEAILTSLYAVQRSSRDNFSGRSTPTSRPDCSCIARRQANKPQDRSLCNLTTRGREYPIVPRCARMWAGHLQPNRAVGVRAYRSNLLELNLFAGKREIFPDKAFVPEVRVDSRDVGVLKHPQVTFHR